MRSAADIICADQAHVWHPYAPAPMQSDPYVVLGGQGAELTLSDAETTHTVVDAMASWWCQIHGYHHPALDAAAHAQIDQLSHVMFGGLTHEPAVAVVERLLALAPGFNRVFLADSGSVAMEIALKLARQVQIARGLNGRTRIATLRSAYHGDTWGVMAIGDPETGMHRLFHGAIQEEVFLPQPPRFGADVKTISTWSAVARDIVHTHRDELAGIVIEPILQGAGGMWPWDPRALITLRELADNYGLVLMADEIATGFGRTGKLWGCDWAGIIPDVMCVGKALTGGYLTQAALLATREIVTTLNNGPHGALMHGPTFMANPLACAISCASLDLIAAGSWRTDVARIEAQLQRGLAPLREHLDVVDVRGIGATGIVELNHPVNVAKAAQIGIDHGVWLRPFMNLIYTLPPYVTSNTQLDQIATAITAIVEAGV